MNPNSANQLWSRWTFTFRLPLNPNHLRRPVFEGIKTEFAKELRRIFGTAAQARVECAVALSAGLRYEVWTIDVRAESTSRPAHDATTREYVVRTLTRFARTGFGPMVELASWSAHVEAGSRQDGTPAQQLVILPPIHDAELAEHQRSLQTSADEE